MDQIIIITVIGSAILIIFLISLFYKNLTRRLQKHADKLNKKFQRTVEPELIDITPNAEKLKELAVNTWRIQKKVDSLVQEFEELPRDTEENQNSDDGSRGNETEQLDSGGAGSNEKGVSENQRSREVLQEDIDSTKLFLGKLEELLEDLGVEYKDYTGQKFNEGLNVEVLSFRTKSDVDEPKVDETVEPTIKVKGKVVEPGKVIVLKSTEENS